MPRNILNRGTVANDGTGDSLRDAIFKINNNFTELYNFLGGQADGEFLSPDVGFDSSNIVFTDTSGLNEMRLGLNKVISGDLQIDLPNSSGTVLVDQANQLLVSPVLDGPILDSNSNELITFISEVNAVNNLEVSNSTGSVTVSTAGDSADIDLILSTKGNGALQLDGALIFDTTLTTGAADPVNIHTPLNIYNRATAIASSLPDGLQVGHFIKIININTGVVTVTPTNFLQGTSFDVPQNAYAEVHWTGSSWHVHADSDVTIT